MKPWQERPSGLVSLTRQCRRNYRDNTEFQADFLVRIDITEKILEVGAILANTLEPIQHGVNQGIQRDLFV